MWTPRVREEAPPRPRPAGLTCTTDFAPGAQVWRPPCGPAVTLALTAQTSPAGSSRCAPPAHATSARTSVQSRKQNLSPSPCPVPPRTTVTPEQGEEPTEGEAVPLRHPVSEWPWTAVTEARKQPRLRSVSRPPGTPRPHADSNRCRLPPGPPALPSALPLGTAQRPPERGSVGVAPRPPRRTPSCPPRPRCAFLHLLRPPSHLLPARRCLPPLSLREAAHLLGPAGTLWVHRAPWAWVSPSWNVTSNAA